MLQPSSEYQQRLIAHDIEYGFTPLEKSVHQSEMRRMLLKKAGGALLTITTVLGVPVSFYSADVRANQTANADASIGLNFIAEANDEANNHAANVFVAGVKTHDADYPASTLSKDIQTLADGQTWSVDVGRATLNYNKMGQLLIDTADKEGVTTLRPVLESAGDGALKAFEYVQAHSDIIVDLWVLIAGPDGVGTLRQASKEQIALLEALARFPEAVDSSYVRRAVELFGFRIDQFTQGNIFENIGNFIKTNNDITDDMESNKLTSTKLIAEQTLSIQSSDLETRFKNAGDLPDDVVHPTVLYLIIPDDTVVHGEKAASQMRSYADPAHIHFVTDTVEGGVHAMPSLSKKGYADAITRVKDDVQESMIEQHYLAGMNKYKGSISINLVPESDSPSPSEDLADAFLVQPDDYPSKP